MNAVNGAMTSVFDAVLWPLELIGNRTALVIVSGIFGVLGLLIFKHISWQKGIKSAKDRIKGHMIEIRIYQDDLVVVGKSVVKILMRNFQYVGLNFGPFIPLLIPFAFVLAQLVVRYAYAPIPVTPETVEVMAGQGTLIEVEFKEAQRTAIADLQVFLPEGVRAVSPLVRAPSDGRAFIEVVATAPGSHELVFDHGGTRETKLLVAGDEPIRTMQPARVAAGNLMSVLYPAEPGFTGESPFAAINFVYPSRDLGWMPGGELGIIIVFFIASMVAGFAALKPLGVQI